MINLKKHFIKAVSIVMIAVIAIMTPLSDYADTHGIGETHAVAPAVIPLAKLFGVIAGAYGIYVAADKLAEETDLWENWTATNDTEAHKSIQDIKLGVASYIVKRQLMKSVANYLGSKVNENVDIITTGAKSSYNTLPDSAYTDSFIEYYDNTLASTYEHPLFIYFKENSLHSSGEYYVFYLNPSYSYHPASGYNYATVTNAYNDPNVEDIVFYCLNGLEPSYGFTLGLGAFDKFGLPLYSLYNYSTSSTYNKDFLVVGDSYVYTSNGWRNYTANRASTTFISYNDLDNGYIKSIEPFYRTTLKSYDSGRDLSEIIESSVVVQNYSVDYSYRGEKASSNETVLIGSAVTASQLDEIYNAMEEDAKEANNNIVQFPGNYPGNDAYKALSNAISIAVANALIQAGIGNNSGEDSGSDSEGSAEQVGLLRQILNALTDSNPIPSLREILELLGKKFGDISIGHNGIINSIAENSPVPTLREINEALGYKLGDIKTSLSTVIDAITQSSPIQALEQIGENIATLPERIAENVGLFIQELFVPDTEELENAVSAMTDKFVFADSLITLWDDILYKIRGANGPPVIWIDFRESKDPRFQSVGMMKAVDFAWYEPYKPYGDSILSAILWVFFILRVLRGVPSIFKGVQSGGEVSTSPAVAPFNVPQIERR